MCRQFNVILKYFFRLHLLRSRICLAITIAPHRVHSGRRSLNPVVNPAVGASESKRRENQIVPTAKHGPHEQARAARLD